MNNRFLSHFAARAVILAGLLTGLLFSSGEGIHLFPFPPAEASQNLDPKAGHAEKIGYQENGQRVERVQDHLQPRHQRDQQDRTAAFPQASTNISWSETLAVDSSVSAASHFFRSQFFASVIRGRAPPIV